MLYNKKDLIKLDTLTDQQRTSFADGNVEGKNLDKGLKLWKFISNSYDEYWKNSAYWFPKESMATIFEVVFDRLNQQMSSKSPATETTRAVRQLGALVAFQAEKKWVLNSCQYVIEAEVKTEIPAYRGKIGPQQVWVEVTGPPDPRASAANMRRKAFSLGGVEQVVIPRLAIKDIPIEDYFIFTKTATLQTSWAKRFAVKYI